MYVDIVAYLQTKSIIIPVITREHATELTWVREMFAKPFPGGVLPCCTCRANCLCMVQTWMQYLSANYITFCILYDQDQIIKIVKRPYSATEERCQCGYYFSQATRTFYFSTACLCLLSQNMARCIESFYRNFIF